MARTFSNSVNLQSEPRLLHHPEHSFSDFLAFFLTEGYIQTRVSAPTIAHIVKTSDFQYVAIIAGGVSTSRKEIGRKASTDGS